MKGPFLIVLVLFGGLILFNGWFGTFYQQSETESFYEQTDSDRYEFYPNQLVFPNND